ncbi:hypothetical protein Lal_00014142 [Lupinus albus]|nr:hypothetical protein Lal_00014142 [Lupinus albus]
MKNSFTFNCQNKHWKGRHPKKHCVLRKLTQCTPTSLDTTFTTTNHPDTQFRVMVGNEVHIFCTEFCPETPIMLQNQLFHIPFNLLLIKGADVVLGIEWLRTLGPVTSNFAIPSMTLMVGSNTITLCNTLNFYFPKYSET